MKIGQAIRNSRKKKEIKGAHLAKKLGISPQLFCDWEAGRREPNASIFVKLANILEIDVSSLEIDINYRRKAKGEAN